MAQNVDRYRINKLQQVHATRVRPGIGNPLPLRPYTPTPLIVHENYRTAIPEQLEEALRIGEQASISRPIRPIRNVIITGLGGSGIGGTIVSEIVANKCPVPVTVNKDYFLRLSPDRRRW